MTQLWTNPFLHVYQGPSHFPLWKWSSPVVCTGADPGSLTLTQSIQLWLELHLTADILDSYLWGDKIPFGPQNDLRSVGTRSECTANLHFWSFQFTWHNLWEGHTCTISAKRTLQGDICLFLKGGGAESGQGTEPDCMLCCCACAFYCTDGWVLDSDHNDWTHEKWEDISGNTFKKDPHDLILARMVGSLVSLCTAQQQTGTVCNHLRFHVHKQTGYCTVNLATEDITMTPHLYFLCCVSQTHHHSL